MHSDAASLPEAPAAAPKPKPTHYRIVCISLYTEDIERLARLVRVRKERGQPKVNKSDVIREGLRLLEERERERERETETIIEHRRASCA